MASICSGWTFTWRSSVEPPEAFFDRQGSGYRKRALPG
jgi:hypothetical protein